MNQRSDAIDIPTHWYNIISDLPFELPPDIQQEGRKGSGGAFKLQVPMALVRQSISMERDIAIPPEVRSRYGAWRPTPLIRARGLEQSIGTKARIYYKYEGNNASGSHKLS